MPINYPVAAHRTYQRLKDHLAFSSVIELFKGKVTKIETSFARAQLLHNEIDIVMTELLGKEIVKKHISCKSGCSFCCYTQVSVTRDEADLLANKIVNGLQVELSYLYIQGEAANSSDDWYKIPHQFRRCVFLNGDGLCSVYDDRPAVCRTNAVLSEPNNCSTEDGIEKPIRLLKTEQADMLIMAAYFHSPENGVLPHMLWQSINRLKGKV